MNNDALDRWITGNYGADLMDTPDCITDEEHDAESVCWKCDLEREPDPDRYDED